jgi:hypothetical protein
MANSIMPTAQVLPRFLLPKLSWTSSATSRHVARSFSALANDRTTSNRPARSQQLFRSGRNARDAQESPSRILRQINHQRAFHATTPRYRDHHFDTLKFVQRLKDEGFSEEQAVAMMRVLSDVIEERYIKFIVCHATQTDSIQHSKSYAHHGPP